MFYKKELLKNMSQGARLRFIRENKGIDPNDIAKYVFYYIFSGINLSI